MCSSLMLNNPKLLYNKYKRTADPATVTKIIVRPTALLLRQAGCLLPECPQRAAWLSPPTKQPRWLCQVVCLHPSACSTVVTACRKNAQAEAAMAATLASAAHHLAPVAEGQSHSPGPAV